MWVLAHLLTHLLAHPRTAHGLNRPPAGSCKLPTAGMWSPCAFCWTAGQRSTARRGQLGSVDGRCWGAASFSGGSSSRQVTCQLLSCGAKSGLQPLPHAPILPQDKAGWSSLMLACRGQPAATRLLLERGAATDIQNSHGYSACHLAADFGAARQLRMLLASGASSDVRTR